MAWYSACPPKLGRLESQGDRMSSQDSGVSLVASYRGDLMGIHAYISASWQSELWLDHIAKDVYPYLISINF